MNQPQAYALAIVTDEEWMDAIKREFPHKRAGDVRYTDEAHGEEGSALRAAYDRYVEAREAWNAQRCACSPIAL